VHAEHLSAAGLEEDAALDAPIATSIKLDVAA
jgi:hypothetical protein